MKVLRPDGRAWNEKDGEQGAPEAIVPAKQRKILQENDRKNF